MRIFATFCSTLLVAALATSLPSYNADPKESSLSGLSAGAFAAVQMHVAFSGTFKGAGVFAGGPYHCAQGTLVNAEIQCMNALMAIDTNSLISTTKLRAALKSVDDVANLANARVYMFSGVEDGTVKQAVMDALYIYYSGLMSSANILYDNKVIAAHTQPTDDPANTNACTASASPYLSNCNFDGAGKALNHIYGALNARNDGTLSGQFIEFDQSEFVSNPTSVGLAPTGWVYVPAICASGQACKVHVSLHGCLQGTEYVGDAYYKRAGYNKWADTNNMIVLYPQTAKSYVAPSNPNGCFDWWGYNDANSYDTNSGVQMKAIKGMLDRLTSGYKP